MKVTLAEAFGEASTSKRLINEPVNAFQKSPPKITLWCDDGLHLVAYLLIQAVAEWFEHIPAFRQHDDHDSGK